MTHFCQALSIFLNLSITLGDRADSIITLPPPPQETLKCLRDDLYSSVKHHWNHLLRPILYLHWVNLGHYSPHLSAIRLQDVYFVLDLVSQSTSQTKSESLSFRLD